MNQREDERGHADQHRYREHEPAQEEPQHRAIVATALLQCNRERLAGHRRTYDGTRVSPCRARSLASP
jgi:hypothetical protein